MCGIAGYIGESKNSAISYRLATRLFETLDQRGEDAAGYYGVQGQTVHYDKQPLKSSEYVGGERWLGMSGRDCQLLIMHARGASQGVGLPADNRNNHPFVNQKGTLALIHNGRVGDAEYQTLLETYTVESSCDSEIIMRIVDDVDLAVAVNSFPSESPSLALRLQGVKNVFSLIREGHMAAAVAESLADEKRLWLFRNSHRPLWVVDVRGALGQVFFVSTPEIWASSVADMDDLQSLPGFSQHKIYELTPFEVWMFSFGGSLSCRRFAVNHPRKKVSGLVKSLKFNNAMAEIRLALVDLETEYALVEGEDSLTPQGHQDVFDRLGGVVATVKNIKAGLER